MNSEHLQFLTVVFNPCGSWVLTDPKLQLVHLEVNEINIPTKNDKSLLDIGTSVVTSNI